ncbi:hypothetical protein SteCoe_21499 [Stentor coeruleus]|uniref:Uncharacterized protein n=1 Tax=Stentor coeruleus TaxID=5963 RepID=A0A1R2BPJ3_9CILI|nr:hypothetical protein SteCoe_21499 [Stentor coeruleus]
MNNRKHEVSNISANGKYAIERYREKISIWEIENEKEIFTIDGYSENLWTAKFNTEDLLVIQNMVTEEAKIFNPANGIEEGKDTESQNEDKEFFQTKSIYKTRHKPFFLYYNTLCSLSKKKYKNLSLKSWSVFISNHLFSPLHFLAYKGETSIIKTILKQGNAILLADNFGHSPIYYSIRGQHQASTDLFLEYLSSLIKRPNTQIFSSSFMAIRNDLLIIIKNSSRYLDKLLSQCVLMKNDKVYIGKPKEKLPILEMFSSATGLSEDFLTKGKLTDVSPTNLLITPFKLPSVIGSKSSIKFLNTLLKSQNTDIFRTKLVQFIIKYRWKILKTWIYSYTGLLWFNLILLIFMFAGYLVVVDIVFFNVNCALVFWDLTQAISKGFAYFKQSSTFVNISRFITTYAWFALTCKGYSFNWLTWFTVFLNAIRGVMGFRAFDATRYHFRLITETLINIKSFLVILVYSTLSFGFMRMALSEDHNISFKGLWADPFGLTIGDIGNMKTEEFGLAYITFCCALVINVILMLNMIISILGDCFDQFQLMAEVYDYREMTQVILEIEHIKSIFKPQDIFKYLHVCLHSHTTSGESWLGKVLDMRTIMEMNSKKIQKKIKKMTKNVSFKVQKAEEKVCFKFKDGNHSTEENLKERIERVENKLSGLDEKVDKMMKLLEGLRYRYAKP